MRLIFEGDNVPVVDTERTLFDGGGGTVLPTVTYSTREQSAPTFQGGAVGDQGADLLQSVFRGRSTIDEISQITDNAGLFMAGEFRSGNGVPPGAGFSGGRYGWPGFSYGGSTYFLAGVLNDVLQVGLALADGKIYAAGGQVILDANGITIKSDSAGGFLKFQKADGTSVADLLQDGSGNLQVYLYSDAALTINSGNLIINRGSTKDATAELREANVLKGSFWWDASETNVSIENFVAGGDVLAVLKGTTPVSENFLVWDRTAAKAIFSVPNDFGWIGASQTWNYVSATSFSVITGAVDLSYIYQKGTKLRLVQGAVTKYFVVQGVSATSVNGIYTLTVTVFNSSDYSIANLTITSNFYSHIENPTGFPDWFNWAPSYSANGSMTYTTVTTTFAMFRVSGHTVFFEISATGTTGGTASTAIIASAPCAVPQTGVAVASVRDATSGSITLGRGGLSAANGIAATKSDNSNWGLGTGRQMLVYGFYDF